MPRTVSRGKKVVPLHPHLPVQIPEPISPPSQSDRQSRLLLTPQEAAKALSINRSTLYVLLMRGEIRSILIGRARRIPLHALEEWIAQQLVA